MAVNTKYESNDSKNDNPFSFTNTSEKLNRETTTNTANNKTVKIGNMDDNGASSTLVTNEINNSKIVDNINNDYYKSLLHYHNIYQRNEIDLFNKTYRFGLFNPYGSLTNTREFLFFTKPDLSILDRNDQGTVSNNLNPALANMPYWKDLFKARRRIIDQLQLSSAPQDNFIHLLQNQVISNLEIPSISAEVTETPTNMYGVNFAYRGTSEASDDSYSFSLEFKDTKWLDVYYFFKSYEEYQTLKHHGVIRPWKYYIENKILHDQFSVYKFLVGEDMETIIYWAKFYGVFPKSLPRDVFSNATFENGISFNIEFQAAFFEDMRPEIIGDFNNISKDFYNAQPYRIDIYNDVLGRTDNRAAKAAYIEKVDTKNRAPGTKGYADALNPNGYVYKLKWKGSDIV